MSDVTLEVFQRTAALETIDTILNNVHSQLHMPTSIDAVRSSQAVRQNIRSLNLHARDLRETLVYCSSEELPLVLMDKFEVSDKPIGTQIRDAVRLLSEEGEALLAFTEAYSVKMFEDAETTEQMELELQAEEGEGEGEGEDGENVVMFPGPPKDTFH